MGKKFDLFLFIASDMGKNNGLAIPDERPPTQTEAAIGLLLNLLTIPGLGTVLFGSERTRRDGMSQLVLFCIGLVLSLCFIGIFLILAAWCVCFCLFGLLVLLLLSVGGGPSFHSF